MTASDAELALRTQLDWSNLLDGMEQEHRFAAPDRQWRFDFAWPARKVAVEVEGGSYVQGRHTTASGFEADATKYNEAALRGWLVLRVVPHMISDGRAIAYLERALALRPVVAP